MEAYVEALMNLVEAATKFSPQWSAYYLSQRAGVAMKPWFIGSAAGVLLQKSAAEIHALSAQRRT